MKYTYNTKNIELTERIQDYAEKKIGRLDKFIAPETPVHVVIRREKGGRDICEVTVYLKGTVLRAEETSDDLFKSIDLVADKLVRQIRRHRTRLEKDLRASAFEPDPAEEPVEEETATVARVKRPVLKPMTPEDAAAQMALLGHAFYMFLDEESGKVCVVYKRTDGDYGLLIPENG